VSSLDAGVTDTSTGLTCTVTSATLSSADELTVVVTAYGGSGSYLAPTVLFGTLAIASTATFTSAAPVTIAGSVSEATETELETGTGTVTVTDAENSALIASCTYSTNGSTTTSTSSYPTYYPTTYITQVEALTANPPQPRNGIVSYPYARRCPEDREAGELDIENAGQMYYFVYLNPATNGVQGTSGNGGCYQYWGDTYNGIPIPNFKLGPVPFKLPSASSLINGAIQVATGLYLIPPGGSVALVTGGAGSGGNGVVTASAQVVAYPQNATQLAQDASPAIQMSLRVIECDDSYAISSGTAISCPTSSAVSSGMF
jgi:hypothetical protein